MDLLSKGKTTAITKNIMKCDRNKALQVLPEMKLFLKNAENTIWILMGASTKMSSQELISKIKYPTDKGDPQSEK